MIEKMTNSSFTRCNHSVVRRLLRKSKLFHIDAEFERLVYIIIMHFLEVFTRLTTGFTRSNQFTKSALYFFTERLDDLY